MLSFTRWQHRKCASGKLYLGLHLGFCNVTSLNSWHHLFSTLFPPHSAPGKQEWPGHHRTVQGCFHSLVSSPFFISDKHNLKNILKFSELSPPKTKIKQRKKQTKNTLSDHLLSTNFLDNISFCTYKGSTHWTSWYFRSDIRSQRKCSQRLNPKRNRQVAYCTCALQHKVFSS